MALMTANDLAFPAPSPIGSLANGDNAAGLALLRLQAGTTITLATVAYPCLSSALSVREHDYLPEGSLNVANPDLRWFNVAPGVPASVGDKLTWSANNWSYTIIAIHPSVLGGEVVGNRLAAYRTPRDTPDSTDDPQVSAWQSAPQT